MIGGWWYLAATGVFGLHNQPQGQPDHDEPPDGLDAASDEPPEASATSRRRNVVSKNTVQHFDSSVARHSEPLAGVRGAPTCKSRVCCALC